MICEVGLGVGRNYPTFKSPSPAEVYGYPSYDYDSWTCDNATHWEAGGMKAIGVILSGKVKPVLFLTLVWVRPAGNWRMALGMPGAGTGI